jgi:hypothetical protein
VQSLPTRNHRFGRFDRADLISGIRIADQAPARGGRMLPCMAGCIIKCAILYNNAAGQHGSPIKLLTDQGSGFYSWSLNRTRFQEYLDDQRIEHIVSDPHSPQTQGKVERLIQTIRTELLSQVKFSGFADAQAQIRSFIQSYNYDRPHQGIDGKRPADRYHGVVGEVEQVESHLAGGELDPSRGYVVLQAQGHRVCLVWSAEGLEVYLDGKLLEGGAS